VCLHNSGFGINVNHQSGEIVSFTVNETVSVVGRISGDADTAAHIVCNFQFAFPKIVIDRFLAERQYAHSNTSDLEMPFGNKFFF